MGTHTILKAVERHKKRTHYVSTDGVYGSLDLDSSLRFTENTAYDLRSPYSASKSAFDRRYAIDFSKIKNELGWQPSVSFEEGIKRTIEWYKGRYAGV